MIYTNEISQEKNPNATAHLYIQDNGLLYKEYFDFNELTRKNIANLLAIASDPRLKKIPELVLPTQIVREQGRVVGYLMPFISGRTMLECIHDAALPFADKLSCFSQLAKVIMELPEDVFIGDLHLKNVIVDHNGKIHLIDMDGFSVQSAYLLSCPMTRLIGEDSRLQLEKYQHNGQPFVSKNTDILCFFDAFLYFLIGGVYFTMYSPKCFSDYLDYLETQSFPGALIEDIRTLFSHAPNRIRVSAFAEIDTAKAARYSFRAFSDHVRDSQ